MAGKVEKANTTFSDFSAEFADRFSHLSAPDVFPVNDFEAGAPQGRGHVLGIIDQAPLPITSAMRFSDWASASGNPMKNRIAA
jgi:hypothetical protein